jgi:hypothetical protein
VGKSAFGQSGNRQAESYARQRARSEIKVAEASLRVAEREAAARRAHVNQDLDAVWGGQRGALDRLSAIACELEILQRRTQILRDERDEIITQLRAVDTSWNSLAMRTGLSRQALSKRARTDT